MAESKRGAERLDDYRIRRRFHRELEIAQGKLGWVDRISNFFASESEEEQYPDLDGAPVLTEQISGDNYKRLTPDMLTIRNVEFQAGIQINKKFIRRDKSDLINLRLGELATRSVTHWAKLVTDLITGGESTAIGNGSGENFFATDHTFWMNGTHSNLLSAGAGYSELNVATATNPTADEMAKAILKVVQHAYSYTDEAGEPLNDEAREFVVMVPVNMMGAAMEAISSNQLETGSGSRDNVLGKEFSISAAVNPRLTMNSADFFVFRTDGGMNPFIRQSEVDTELTVLGPDSEFCALNNGECLWKIEATRNAGYGQWWKALKATLS